MKVINLIGQPGAGKSTAAAGLFFLMKQRHLNVELVTEYTKDVIFERHNFILSDELLVFAEKYKRIKRLESAVDFAITDSPLLNSVIYCQSYSASGRAFFKEIAQSFDNIYVLVSRPDRPYARLGRLHDEDEASRYARLFRDFLERENIDFIEVSGDASAPDTILESPVMKSLIEATRPLFALS